MFCGAPLQLVAGSEEIRRVTVLFADLAHSTAIISGIAPEQARTLLDGVVYRMRAAVGQFGVTVSRVAGDGIMALFGAPLAVEDHPRRAALAALRMQEQMELLPLLGPRGERLAICVGVNTGDVLIRSVASDLHVEYTAEGVTTHQAAKLQQAARPGAVLVSAEVARLVEGFVELRPHPPIGLQDFGVYELMRATGTHSRFKAAVGRGLSPFVGREHELARLQAWANAAEGGRVQMISVVGEAGVGKSRLLWEFGQRQRDRGWRVCSVSATASGAAVAFHPVLDLLLGLYGIDPHDSDD
ncbi:MAG: AAA family ATPase, partial [Aquincola sp.]|nr:AAA family ATPase [Aquincola sp.]